MTTQINLAQWNQMGAFLDSLGGPSLNPAGNVPVGLMTPDALMTYCETRLGDLDSQMKKEFDDQQVNSQRQADLNKVGDLLTGVTSGFCVDDNSTIAPYGTPHTGSQLLNDLQQQIDDPGCDPATKSQLIELRDTIAKGIGGQPLADMIDKDPAGTINGMMSCNSDTDFLTSHGCGLPAQDANGKRTITAETVSSWQNDLKSMASDVSNDGQMGMIRLQSLMSERQTAIQLCTNLVQSLADQTKSIASNVGH